MSRALYRTGSAMVWHGSGAHDTQVARCDNALALRTASNGAAAGVAAGARPASRGGGAALPADVSAALYRGRAAAGGTGALPPMRDDEPYLRYLEAKLAGDAGPEGFD